jgi:hypothetical protein
LSELALEVGNGLDGICYLVARHQALSRVGRRFPLSTRSYFDQHGPPRASWHRGNWIVSAQATNVVRTNTQAGAYHLRPSRERDPRHAA